VAREISRRGVKAIEAFGRIENGQDEPGQRPAAQHDLDSGVEHRCLLPADYLLAVGFKTVRPHPRTPRLRLDIRSVASWREDVEYAIDRLLSGISSPALSR
jgi:hypothetical protein